MIRNIIYIILTLTIISGCATSKCVDPDINVPDSLTMNAENDSLCIADLAWMELVGDTLLTDMIQRALTYNKNLLAASARIREYEKLYNVQKKAMLPSLDFDAYADRETNNKTGAKPVEEVEVVAKLTLSWEADLFGKLRWSGKQALARYLQKVETQRAIQMQLIANVATAYFELVALDKEMQIVQSTIATRQENVKQAKLRFDGGLVSEIPYQQAKVELAKTAAMLPDLKHKIKMKENELSFLTGALPSKVSRSTIESQILKIDTLLVGIPSDVLKRRPDVKNAEYALQEAMAAVGYNWADRFPRFVIGLEGGFENNGFKGFFNAPLTYMIGELTSPIFSFGKKKAKYQAALEAYDAQRFKYEETILQAFREVDNAITAYLAEKETADLMLSLKTASQKYVELARFQYLNGQIEYIDVLDAQRSHFNAEIDYSNAIRDRYLALISLYKALGGGIPR
ncbi:MAG: TolC family protein [Bacteroidales bacterium]|nr:TolC family protein [Bacteroidales bacterium]